MQTPMPDEYQVGSLINGLPTCTFRSQPYNRKITNIVVANGVSSGVAVYRGALGTVPVASNPVGANNTLKGTINIPAGQSFWVQWDAAATSASEATARVSFLRDSDPFALGVSEAMEWSVNVVSEINIPSDRGPFDPGFYIGPTVPTELTDYYDLLNASETNPSVWLMFYGGNPNPYYYRITASQGGVYYVYEGWVMDPSSGIINEKSYWQLDTNFDDMRISEGRDPATTDYSFLTANPGL